MSITFVEKPIVQARIMGIDPSTYTGIVTMAGNAVLMTEVVHPDPKHYVGYERLQLIADGVLAHVLYQKPDYVFIERPITMGKFNAEIQQQIATLIRDRMYTHGRDWFDVSPTSLKKWVTGAGHAKKKDMAKAVEAKWNFVHKSDDVIDAYSLCRLGQYVVAQLPQVVKGVQHAQGKRVQAVCS